MKIINALLFCAVFAFWVHSGTSQSVSSNPKICVIRVGTCNSSVNVCGRMGRSDLCTKFRNSCDLAVASCSGIQYTTVSSSFCTGLAVGARGRCRGSSTSSSSSILSSLLSSPSSSSSSSVTPIIIRG